MTSESVDLNRAYQLLRETVVALLESGKTAATAGIKPEMQRRSYGGFDERRLGFATFGEFIRSAQDAGIVRVTKTGPGFTHVAIADGDAAEPVGPRRGPSRRIRADLWSAFINWDLSPRFWDVDARRVVEEPPTALSQRDRRLVEISRVTRADQLNWMREYADSLGEHPLAPALRAVLESERAPQGFAALLRSDRSLQARWSHRRLTLVAEHISRWTIAHSLEVPIWEEERNSSAADLRALLHRALDEIHDDQLPLVALPAGALLKAND